MNFRFVQDGRAVYPDGKIRFLVPEENSGAEDLRAVIKEMIDL